MGDYRQFQGCQHFCCLVQAHRFEWFDSSTRLLHLSSIDSVNLEHNMKSDKKALTNWTQMTTKCKNILLKTILTFAVIPRYKNKWFDRENVCRVEFNSCRARSSSLPKVWWVRLICKQIIIWMRVPFVSLPLRLHLQPHPLRPNPEYPACSRHWLTSLSCSKSYQTSRQEISRTKHIYFPVGISVLWLTIMFM